MTHLFTHSVSVFKNSAFVLSSPSYYSYPNPLLGKFLEAARQYQMRKQPWDIVTYNNANARASAGAVTEERCRERCDSATVRRESWAEFMLVSRPIQQDSEEWSPSQNSRGSKLRWEIEGSGFKLAAVSGFSCGEADEGAYSVWVWVGRDGQHGETVQASERACVGRGLKMVEQWGECEFYRRWKRRLARARALPNAADAKPAGANTAPEITKTKKRIK